MHGRWFRVLVLCAGTLALTAAAFLLSPPDWLATDNGPVRKIVEALSWVVTIIVPVSAFASGLWRWVREGKRTANADMETHHQGSATEQLLPGRALHLIDDHLPKVSDVDMLTLGVTPALDTDSEADLPPFVHRDTDNYLDAKICDSGMVLLHGPAACGKSRVVAEAIRRVRPRSSLLVPSSGGALRDLARFGLPTHDTVIWLDDLQNYLTADGLDTAVFQQLFNSTNEVTIVATIRDGVLARYDLASTGSHDEPNIASSGADLIEQIRGNRRFHLGRQLSNIERASAARHADPRILSAASAPEGFGEYLAAGPAMFARWSIGESDVFQLGQAIISAGVDVRRAGYHQPISEDKLYDLSRNYLASAWQGRADLPTARDGFTWACKKVLGASSCLQQRSGGTYIAADYLLEHCQSKKSPLAGMRISPAIWRTVLPLASPAQLFTIGVAAFEALQTKTAEGAFRQISESGHVAGMRGLATVLNIQGKNGEAESWYRKAVEGGDVIALGGLGRILNEKGDHKEAETVLCRGARRGDKRSFLGLGDLLSGQGRLEEAEAAYRDAAVRGDDLALSRVRRLLARKGNVDEVEHIYRRAAKTEGGKALLALGMFLQEQGTFGEAETVYRRAADADSIHSGEALNRLGVLLIQQDRLTEAETVYRRAADADSIRSGEALNRLGVLLIQQDRLTEAETVYRRGTETNSIQSRDCFKRLCHLLVQQERIDEAEVLYRHAIATGGIPPVELDRILEQRDRLHCIENDYRQAANNGNAIGLKNFAEFLVRQGRLDEAESAYRRIIDVSSTIGTDAFAAFLERQGRLDEAEDIYCQVANNGNAIGVKKLAEFLVRQGRLDEAESAYRRTIDASSTIGTDAFAAFLERQGRLDEAEAIYRQAAAAGESMAQRHLGNLLEKQGRLDEAEGAYRNAADGGNIEMLRNLAELLERAGRRDDAEGVYREAANTGATTAQCRLGRFLEQQGRLYEAMTSFRRAANRGDTTGLQKLGELLERDERPNEAESNYYRLLNTDSHALIGFGLGGSASIRLAQLLERQDRLDEAESVYRRAVNMGDVCAGRHLDRLTSLRDQ